MADDTEIERMLEEKMHEDKRPVQETSDDKKDKEKKSKKHKHHKHHKSHKTEKKNERKRSRSRENESQRRHRHSPTLPSGKRRDVNTELHQLAQTINHRSESKDKSSSKTIRREKTPELTPEERDLRTVFCKTIGIFKIGIYRHRDISYVVLLF
jgi:hypothetical protein